MANEKTTALQFVEKVLQEASCHSFTEVSLFTVFDRVCTDGTLEMLREHAVSEPRLKVVFAAESRCVVDAYMAGYDHALKAGCDWILEMDAGFSHDPESIGDFLQHIADPVDVIYGTRFTLGGRIQNSSFKRRLISKFGGITSNILLGTRLGDMTSGYILYSRHALQQVLERGILSKGPFFQTEMKYHARHLKYAEVPIIYSGASHHIGKRAMMDARSNLRRLALDRIQTIFKKNP
jgi:dolichol-phosphate mannosyltransferase